MEGWEDSQVEHGELLEAGWHKGGTLSIVADISGGMGGLPESAVFTVVKLGGVLFYRTGEVVAPEGWIRACYVVRGGFLSQIPSERLGS